MSIFDWFKGAPDPQEPASPPPFTVGDRVTVSPAAVDGMFLGGRRGVVVSHQFTTDPEDVFGPWIIWVILDDDPTRQKFHAAELTRAPKHVAPLPRRVISVTQPEDTEEYTGQGEIPPTGYLLEETPLYDDVSQSAMARDGLAAEVEAWLAGGAS
jgi:hypothetical protein